MGELQTVWGWQPALYLFLGGMGGGAFLMAGILYYYDRACSMKTLAVSAWASVIALVVGLLLLVTELTNPLRGMLLWQSFSNFSSWMAIGAWLLFAAVIVMGLTALFTTVFKRGSGALGVLVPVGMVLGLGVAVYTGILLSVANIPFWNTALLPCLFTVSAVDTGIALVELITIGTERNAIRPDVPEPDQEKSHLLMSRLVAVLVIVELIVLFAFLLTAGSGQQPGESQAAAWSASLLISGGFAVTFWALVIVCGLLVPLSVACKGLKAPAPDGLVAVGAIGALVGGCALRFLVVLAGSHADVVANAVAALVL